MLKKNLLLGMITILPFSLSLAGEIDPLKIPIPEGAKGPSISVKKGYYVGEIEDGVFWATNGAYQSMFMTTGKGVIVVDAPPSIGDNLLKAIREVTSEPITHLIYSHSHKDHIGAASRLPKSVKVIAQKEVGKILSHVKDPNRYLPTTTFETDYLLKVGNKKLKLNYPEKVIQVAIYLFMQKSRKC